MHAECPVCGASFEKATYNNIYCSFKCKLKRNKQQEICSYRRMISALNEPPLYSKTQYREAKHHIEMYSDPALARGREYLLIRAHQIVDYWNKREYTINRVARLRAQSRETTSRHYFKQKEKKNDKTIQPTT
jgi:predicted nucleic acid-binding Zn ribbon protein